MVELLVVIAVIAILAALLFPVLASVQRQTRQTTCMSQMHEIQKAAKLYFLDNNKYPASLLGFAQNGAGEFYIGSNGPVIPIDRLTYRPLTTSQRYLKAKDPFLCPDNPKLDPAAVMTAFYPTSVPLAGNGVVFNPTIHHNIGDDKAVPEGQPAYFYAYDSYDVGPEVGTDGKATGRNELHYSLDWTGASGTLDAQNQLKYPNPPEDSTVLTWCTHHAALSHADKVVVMMLSGKVKTAPVEAFVTKGPLGFKF